jgi:hypothetical protein
MEAYHPFGSRWDEWPPMPVARFRASAKVTGVHLSCAAVTDQRHIWDGMLGGAKWPGRDEAESTLVRTMTPTWCSNGILADLATTPWLTVILGEPGSDCPLKALTCHGAVRDTLAPAADRGGHRRPPHRPRSLGAARSGRRATPRRWQPSGPAGGRRRGRHELKLHGFFLNRQHRELYGAGWW